VVVHVAPGPFEDDHGVPAQFAVPAHLPKHKKLLGVRRDLLTAVAELARKVAFWQTDLVLGEGQGGLVVFAFSKPLVLEAALQARNLQRKEAQTVAEGWGSVRGCLASVPRWSRKDMGTAEWTEAVPELKAEFAKEDRWFGLIRDRRSPHHAEEESFKEQFVLNAFQSADAVPWDQVLSRGLTVMFDHGGVCPCGRRTYLFGQCAKCINDEAKETVAQALERLADVDADARDLGPGVYAEPVAAAGTARSGEKLLLLTDAAVLKAVSAAEAGTGLLEDVTVAVSAWRPAERLRLGPVRDPRRPFRWMALVSGEEVLELQSCVSMPAEVHHAWDVKPWRGRLSPGTNATLNEAAKKVVEDNSAR